MRRKFLHRVVVYGLVGLVVNVGIAWAFASWGKVGQAAWSATFGGFGDVAKATDLRWRWSPPSLVATGPELRLESTGVGLTTVVQGVPGYNYFQYEVRSGWPWPAVAYGGENDLLASSRTDVQRGPALPLPKYWSDLATNGWDPVPRRLGLTPAWGLAANTAAYGALLWALAASLAWMRHWNRRRRGRCPSCAYDLCGTLESGCPECGWARGAVVKA